MELHITREQSRKFRKAAKDTIQARTSKNGRIAVFGVAPFGDAEACLTKCEQALAVGGIVDVKVLVCQGWALGLMNR